MVLEGVHVMASYLVYNKTAFYGVKSKNKVLVKKTNN